MYDSVANCLALITLIFAVSKPFWNLLFLHWHIQTSWINLDCRHEMLFRLSTVVSSLVAVAVSSWVNGDSGCDSSKQWCLTKPFKGRFSGIWYSATGYMNMVTFPSSIEMEMSLHQNCEFGTVIFERIYWKYPKNMTKSILT